jgi:hypothetical protein
VCVNINSIIKWCERQVSSVLHDKWQVTYGECNAILF